MLPTLPFEDRIHNRLPSRSAFRNGFRPGRISVDSKIHLGWLPAQFSSVIASLTRIPLEPMLFSSRGMGIQILEISFVFPLFAQQIGFPGFQRFLARFQIHPRQYMIPVRILDC